jgi:hypothetical protein
MVSKVEFGLFPTSTATSIYDVTFLDASLYLRDISISRGKSTELDSYDAATAKVRLSNENRMFDPSYSSPFSPAVAPTGVLRISKDGVVLFTGLIQDWNFNYDQSGDAVAEIAATDAFWLLSNLTLNAHTPADNQSSTARLQTILQRPEVNWSLAQTKFSLGESILGGNSAEFNISQGYGVLEYMQEVEKAEPGRLFVNKDGKLVFKSRIDDIFAINYSYTRQNLSTNPSFENDTTGWTGGGAGLSRSTSFAYVGSASALVAAGGSADQVFNAVGNQPYTISFFTRPSGASATFDVTVSESYNGTSFDTLQTGSITTTASAIRTNLCWNTGVEVSTFGWFSPASACAITAVTSDDAISGSKIARMTWNGTSGSLQISNYTGSSTRQSVTAGLDYTYSIYLREGSNPTLVTFKVAMDWYNSLGTYITTTGSSYSSLNSSFQRYSISGTAPVGAVTVALTVVPSSAPAAGTIIEADAVMLEQAATLGDFFDSYSNRTNTIGYRMLSPNAYSQGNSLAESWDRWSFQVTVDDAYNLGRLSFGTTPSAYYLDAVLIEPSPILDSYFDGSNGSNDQVIDQVSYSYTEVWNT